jgi:hypothetical protein
MNFFDMFNKLESVQPNPEENMIDPAYHEPTFTETLPPDYNWQDNFNGFKTHPVLYNMDGYISPYASNNWGGTSAILKTLDDVSRLPPLSDRIDPNKIFNSDIASLKTLAADQIRVTKMFERKLMDSLSARGKQGLNEEDIMAMQALTASRNAITAINKEQISIKKNIADLRIKQNSGSSNVNNNDGEVRNGMSSTDQGLSMLDSIFKVTSTPMDMSSINNMNVPEEAGDDAIRAIDERVSPDEIDSDVQFEATGAKTYAVVGPDDHVEYVTKTATGEEIPEYHNPSTKIASIDIESGKVVDELHREFDIIK